jgi:transposase
MRTARGSLLGARAQLVGMTTRLSNMTRGVLKTFGLMPGTGGGLKLIRASKHCSRVFDEIALVERPLLAPGGNCASRLRSSRRRYCNSQDGPVCRLIMSVPGIGALSFLMYVSTIENPGRFFLER